MSEENTSQANPEEVVSDESSQTLLGAEHVEEEVKEPAPLYEDKVDSDKPEEGSAEDTEDKDAEAESKPEDKKEDPKEENEEDKKEEESKEDGDKEEYSLEAPEDSLLAKTDVERIEAYAKENGLGKDAAEKLMSDQGELLSTHNDKLVQDHNEKTQEWIEDCKSDKEIGGEKFGESTNLATKAIRHFGTDKLIEGLNATGFGNNVELIRVFSRIGRAMSDDKSIKSSMKVGEDVSMADRMYPQTTN